MAQHTNPWVFPSSLRVIDNMLLLNCPLGAFFVVLFCFFFSIKYRKVEGWHIYPCGCVSISMPITRSIKERKAISGERSWREDARG